MGSVPSAKTPNKIVTATPTATAAGLFRLAAVSARTPELSNPTRADLRRVTGINEIKCP